MNMVIPNEGKTQMLEQLFRTAAAREDFKLDLFQSNTTVGNASTAGDFTIATFTGYAQAAIARADFSAATVVSNEGSITKTAAPTFTCSGGSPQTVYGWILRGATTGVIYAGQNFDTPRVMSTGAVEAIDPFTIKDKTYA